LLLTSSQIMLISDENIEIKFTMRNQKVSHILILSDPSDPLANTAKEKHYQTSNSCLPTLPPCLIAETKGTNGWSHPPVDIFHVRGPTYLDDKKKVVSGPYLLTARGCDLFLTKDARLFSIVFPITAIPTFWEVNYVESQLLSSTFAFRGVSSCFTLKSPRSIVPF